MSMGRVVRLAKAVRSCLWDLLFGNRTNLGVSLLSDHKGALNKGGARVVDAI